MPSILNTRDQLLGIAARPPMNTSDVLLGIAAIFSFALVYFDQARSALFALAGVIEIVAIVTGRTSRRIDAVLTLLKSETQRPDNIGTADSR